MKNLDVKSMLVGAGITIVIIKLVLPRVAPAVAAKVS